jgi:hypothetical protein
MKKFRLSLLLSLLLLALCLVSCDALFEEIPLGSEAETVTDIYVSFDTIPEKSTAGATEETAEEPAEVPTEEPTDEPTEEPTEEVTEEVTEEETEPPIPCSHDYPQDAVDQLIAEGQDVEQLKFQKGPDLRFQYVVILNKRILRHGEQLQISTVHLASGFDVIDIKELYDFFHEGNMSPLMLRSASNQLIPIDLVDTPYGWEFIFTVPDDMEPGVYRLELDLRNENYIGLCKIVIY